MPKIMQDLIKQYVEVTETVPAEAETLTLLIA